jgi:hypothetical protein
MQFEVATSCSVGLLSHVPNWGCYPCRWQKRGRRGAADTSKPRETARSRSQALLGLKKGARPDGHDLGRASQFDLAINKERKLISNLRWNMPIFIQIVPNIWPSGQYDKAID